MGPVAMELMNRQKDLGTGPPHGSGHYSEDSRRWWDDRHQRWFPVTDQEDQLEIEAEDVGSSSLPARLLTTLVTQYGTPYYRFVGHARSADRHWPTYQVIGATFPATGLEDPAAQERGPRSNGPAWASCTSSCSGRGGGWWGVASTGGRGATGGRWWT